MILDFLINHDFKVSDNYSYVELISYLKTMQAEYKKCVDTYKGLNDSKNNFEKIIIHNNMVINDLEEVLKKEREKTSKIIWKCQKKLSILERITGKIKLKL